MMPNMLKDAEGGLEVSWPRHCRTNEVKCRSRMLNVACRNVLSVFLHVNAIEPAALSHCVCVCAKLLHAIGIEREGERGIGGWRRCNSL